MQLYIDVRSGVPIYDQICSQFKAQILGGVLPEDTALPSIRGLAKDLRISVITTRRAYEELEREGFIYTVAGKGCFVAKHDGAVWREEYLRRIEAHLSEVRRLAALCGMSEAEIAEIYRLTGEEAL